MSELTTIFTLANFNLQNFNAALKKEFIGSSLSSVEYEQMFSYLINIEPAKEKKGIGICWLTLSDLVQAKTLKIDLVQMVLKLNQVFQYSVVILPALDSPALNIFQEQDLRNQFYQFNLSLSQRSAETTIVVLDPTSWLVAQGPGSVSSPMWYLSKTPFHKNVFKHAALWCKSSIDAFKGQSKKVLIVDLDDTLWGGIVGDDGMENLKIGGHDALGEAFADFQTSIKQIKSWGVILCICSKNDENIAMEVLEKHDGMILKKDDFVKWRINWNDKATNILELINELNVGMDSVVFFDDNPAERDRVRTALPGIFVPDLPLDKMEYPAFIRSLSCFNRMALTEEDKNRTNLYQAEQTRTDTQHSFASVDEWIDSLNIEIKFEELTELNINRAVQLLNKTNQMNLRTRRLGKEELMNWALQPNHWFFAVTVKDIFGDNGITGLIGFHKTNDNELLVDDFVMSCRVMGRKIENRMLDFLLEMASTHQAIKLIAEYLPTEKNKPIFDFFKNQHIKLLHFSY